VAGDGLLDGAGVENVGARGGGALEIPKAGGVPRDDGDLVSAG
jgi:hypothetical protein